MPAREGQLGGVDEPDHPLPTEAGLRAVLTLLFGDQHLADLLVCQLHGALVIAGELEQAQVLHKALMTATTATLRMARRGWLTSWEVSRRGLAISSFTQRHPRAMRRVARVLATILTAAHSGVAAFSSVPAWPGFNVP